MNKILSRVIGGALGLAMAVGVGTAISSIKDGAVAAYADVTTDEGFEAATMGKGTNASDCTVGGDDGIKVGTSSKGGTMTVTVPSGATVLRVYSAAWKGVSGLSLNITSNTEATITPTSISLTADDGISNNTPFTLSGEKTDFRFDLNLSGVTSQTKFTFSSSIAKRFVLWDAQYKVPEIAVTSVSLNKTSTSIDVGGSEQLLATILPDNATNKNVAWSVTGDSDITVSSDGLVSVANTATVGDTATIKATSEADSSKYATCDITVTANVPVSSVSLNKESTSIEEGKTETLTATVLPADATNKSVTWTSSDETVATVEDGLVTALKAGTTTITATSESDSTKSDSCEVTVTGYVGETYTKVTSAPADWRGTYLLVNEASETSAKVFNSTMETFDVTNKYLSAEIDSSAIKGTKDIDAAAIRIERDTISNTSYYFAKCGNGDYLSRSSNISHTSEKSADIAITFTGTELLCGGYYLRYNANSGQDRFRFYSGKSVSDVALYKMNDNGYVAEADTYASTFKSETSSICTNYQTNTAESFSGVWEVANTGLKAKFEALSVDAQGVLANTTYVHNSGSNTNTQDAIDRYDWIISRYPTLSDFINRKDLVDVYQDTYSSLTTTNGTNNSNVNGVATIVIVTSLVTLTALGAFLFLKKKEQ